VEFFLDTAFPPRLSESDGGLARQIYGGQAFQKQP